MENLTNKVVLTGCAGNDVVVKNLSANQKVARVSIAVNEHYKNAAGEEVKKTNWFDLTFWNAKADQAMEQIKKGTLLTIEGKLQSGSYEAKDGTKRYTTDIVVNAMTVKEAKVAN